MYFKVRKMKCWVIFVSLRSNHTKRKGKYSLIFVVFYLIFFTSLSFLHSLPLFAG